MSLNGVVLATATAPTYVYDWETSTILRIVNRDSTNNKRRDRGNS